MYLRTINVSNSGSVGAKQDDKYKQKKWIPTFKEFYITLHVSALYLTHIMRISHHASAYFHREKSVSLAHLRDKYPIVSLEI